MQDLYRFDEIYSIVEKMYLESRGSVKLALLLSELRRSAIRYERLNEEIRRAELLLSGARIPSSGALESDSIVIDRLIEDLKDVTKRLDRNGKEFGDSVSKVNKILIEMIERPEVCGEACEREKLEELLSSWMSWLSEISERLDKWNSLFDELLERGTLKDIREAKERVLESSKRKEGMLGRILRMLSRKPPEEGERH